MSGEITVWIEKLRAGDAAALDRLVPMLYDELRALARRLLASERAGQTLTPTALVHEAYVRLARERRIAAGDRGEFFGVAAVAMRRILIDAARRKQRLKRGGGADRVDLESPDAIEALVADDEIEELLAIDSALDRLGAVSGRARRVVELRIFVGLGVEECAAILGVHEKTVRRDWLTARAWLRRELGGGPSAALS